MKWLLPPILLVVCVVAMIALFRSVPLVELLPWQAAYAIGIPLTVAGLALSITASSRFRRLGTNINTFRKPGVLVTDGAFAWSRNPMYLGFAVALLGFAVKLNALSAFGVVVAFVLVTDLWYIRHEERMARQTFGAAYDEYRSRTRRWF